MEEQAEEIEVLTSIFPEELEIVAVAPHTFKIHLVPNPGADDNHGQPQILHLRLFVLVRPCFCRLLSNFFVRC
jgi:hypothetical protein